MKKLKTIPKFKSEDEERDFWAIHDSTNYIDLSKAKRVTFPNLRRTTKLVAINMPISLLDNLKFLANKMDIAYQSLMKMFLSERVKKELHAKR
ncbi:MAG: BrnA antitoxin family protein [Elusimicrobia bacterium]|nr:BrnA antitoxin family protein [Elusimicrobiota bacterium]